MLPKRICCIRYCIAIVSELRSSGRSRWELSILHIIWAGELLLFISECILIYAHEDKRNLPALACLPLQWKYKGVFRWQDILADCKCGSDQANGFFILLLSIYRGKHLNRKCDPKRNSLCGRCKLCDPEIRDQVYWVNQEDEVSVFFDLCWTGTTG